MLCDRVGMPDAAPMSTFPSESRGSRLLGGSADQARAILTSQPATVTFHGRCLSPAAFRGGQLDNDFSLMATSRDGAGAAFVSVIEHKR